VVPGWNSMVVLSRPSVQKVVAWQAASGWFEGAEVSSLTGRMRLWWARPDWRPKALMKVVISFWQ
jgi:hypothetical protein